uniref:TSA: Wollemia nobilis Ref_Wollemi_Transcript_9583_1375 transcribed RNA sequence n=1 Tax=Wollemia nobilis TaxID=56998 RepID=A0A0C9RN41_9CONI
MMNGVYSGSRSRKRPSLADHLYRPSNFGAGTFPYVYGGIFRPLPIPSSGAGVCTAGEVSNGGPNSHHDFLEAKALAASRNHSEAERRRRERINEHLSTLKRLLPTTNKMDKATLLAEVIHHVKELKKRAAEVAKGGPIPTDCDELSVESDGGDERGRTFIRASVCCDDRPDLLVDLIRAFQNLRLKTIKAEISSLGGRVKNVFLVTSEEEINCDKDETQSINCVQEALKEVLDRSALSEFSSLRNSVSNKRQRILLFDSCSS